MEEYVIFVLVMEPVEQMENVNVIKIFSMDRRVGVVKHVNQRPTVRYVLVMEIA
tara:strand:- start:4315 stop:4476 length:162 start_codon:yes stop_codon:yes gene_type:complete